MDSVGSIFFAPPKIHPRFWLLKALRAQKIGHKCGFSSEMPVNWGKGHHMGHPDQFEFTR